MKSPGTLRDWEVRNQGQQPLNAPSPKTATEADIAAPTEGRHPNGDVDDQPGAMRGTGSRGGTGSSTTKGV